MFDKETDWDEASYAVKTNGTGPYTIDDYTINSHLNLKLRAGYWGTAPGIPNLKFKVLVEDSQRVNALQTGEVDIAGIPFQEIDFIADIDGLTTWLYNSTWVEAIVMNPTSSRNGFSKLGADARRAISYAIDRQKIVDVVYNGYATISKFPLSAGTPDAYDALFNLGIYGEENNGYNPEKAKALAESSGLVNTTLTLVNNGGAIESLISELVQANLKAVGVEIEIKSYDSGSWLTVLFDPTQWDMCVNFIFGDTVGAGYVFATNLFVSYEAEQWPGHDRFYEITETVTEKTDVAELQALYKELTDIIVDNMHWFALADTMTPTAYASDLKGWDPLQTGSVVYSDLSW
jgi:peptide/nickel transport system substrate-binding protein